MRHVWIRVPSALLTGIALVGLLALGALAAEGPAGTSGQKVAEYGYTNGNQFNAEIPEEPAEPEPPAVPEQPLEPEKPTAALPSVEGSVIYANGAALLVAADGEGTTVYVDANDDGALDEGDRSLFALDIPGAPENGADLSGYSINAVGVDGAENATVTVLSGVIGGVDYGEPPKELPEELPEEIPEELPELEEVFFAEEVPEPPQYYLNVLAVRGGALYVDYSRAAAGTELTMVLTPEDGNALDELLVTGPDGEALELTEQPDRSYRFLMPEGDVCLTVLYRKTA